MVDPAHPRPPSVSRPKRFTPIRKSDTGSHRDCRKQFHLSLLSLPYTGSPKGPRPQADEGLERRMIATKESRMPLDVGRVVKPALFAWTVTCLYLRDDFLVPHLHPLWLGGCATGLTIRIG